MIGHRLRNIGRVPTPRDISPVWNVLRGIRGFVVQILARELQMILAASALTRIQLFPGSIGLIGQGTEGNIGGDPENIWV
jgi:hypothetical protein